MKSKLRNFRLLILSMLGQALFSFVFRTGRWNISGEEHLRRVLENKEPVLLCSWHGRLSFISFYLHRAKIKPWAIASRHGDGDIMARILMRWGMKLIRGSSKKGGRGVLKKMGEAFSSSVPVVAITNDGPKGPARVAKSGSVTLARKYNAQIIAISGSASRYWQFNSWDRFRLPKPFSRIYIRISSPMPFPDELPETPEAESKLVTDFLNRNQDLVDKMQEGK